MNESAIITWLDSLTHKQFVDFFYRAVANRNTSDLAEWQGHLVLSDAEKVTGERWSTVVIALPEDDNFADECPICQSGTCETCGIQVRSVAKRAICPVCLSKVYCT